MIFRDWLKELDYTLLQGSVDVETQFHSPGVKSRCACPGNRKTGGRRAEKQRPL